MKMKSQFISSNVLFKMQSEQRKRVDLRRSKLLDAQASEPLAHVNRLLERLALDDTSEETASKGVASTVGVGDLRRVNGVDRELLDGILALNGDEGGLGALGDDGNTLALAVLLGEVGQVLDDVLGLLGGEVVRLGVRGSLGLVADDVVPVGGAGVDGLLEELGDEGSGEGQNKDLVLLGRILGELHDGGRADWSASGQYDDTTTILEIQGREIYERHTGEVEATNVEDIGVLGKGPDLGLLQVVEVVVVGGAEVGAERAVVAGDNGAAAAGGLLGVDAVLDTKAGGLDGIVKGGGVLVIADAAKIDDAVGGEDVLGAAGAVLGGAAGDQLGLVVVEEVLVERDVLLLSQDGVVGLELVLVEELLVTDGLDVCREVALVNQMPQVQE